jgi:hypothetical protein
VVAKTVGFAEMILVVGRSCGWSSITHASQAYAWSGRTNRRLTKYSN